MDSLSNLSNLSNEKLNSRYFFSLDADRNSFHSHMVRAKLVSLYNVACLERASLFPFMGYLPFSHYGKRLATICIRFSC